MTTAEAVATEVPQVHSTSIVLDALTPLYVLDEPYTSALAAGGVSAGFLSIASPQPWDEVLRRTETALTKIEKSPLLTLATCAADIRRAKREGRIALVLITLVGFLGKNLIGRSIVEFGDGLFNRTPLVRTVHKSLKQIFETVLKDKGTSFNKAAMIEYPSPGLWAIVFVATDARGEIATKFKAMGQDISAEGKVWTSKDVPLVLVKLEMTMNAAGQKIAFGASIHTRIGWSSIRGGSVAARSRTASPSAVMVWSRSPSANSTRRRARRRHSPCASTRDAVASCRSERGSAWATNRSTCRRARSTC